MTASVDTFFLNNLFQFMDFLGICICYILEALRNFPDTLLSEIKFFVLDFPDIFVFDTVYGFFYHAIPLS